MKTFAAILLIGISTASANDFHQQIERYLDREGLSCPAIRKVDAIAAIEDGGLAAAAKCTNGKSYAVLFNADQSFRSAMDCWIFEQATQTKCWR